MLTKNNKDFRDRNRKSTDDLKNEIYETNLTVCDDAEAEVSCSRCSGQDSPWGSTSPRTTAKTGWHAQRFMHNQMKTWEQFNSFML